MVGGGHAGVEAAWAAANLLPESDFGAGSVALVTLDPAKIGVMSCNPAIGGLAKGQLVREIDAMGGLMGLAADATGIHFKMLNTSKGPAVRGPRCQNDKHAYAEEVQRLVRTRPEIEIVEGAVETIETDVVAGARVCRGVGVRTGSGQVIVEAPAIVLTTGTFMRGLMHTGETKTPGGRQGESAASAVSGALSDLGFELGRLKTGTPPRLRKSSIEWDSLPEQPGDSEPVPFSELTNAGGGPGTGQDVVSGGLPSFERFPVLGQVDCRQTSTTGEAHDVIRANLHRAPMYSGVIESTGPRYCPSIEDKVVRFTDRESHGVFLEPESHRTEWVYCNGISSSLPEDVQDIIVRAMPGCSKAEILQYGYAVEYDIVRPHQIRATAETKAVSGFFLAGQINGTSGYEEAGAQGLIAGINAARLARSEPVDFTLGRDVAYIGVLMDDLVTKTPVEPYRMFTSRAEHRLLLRADNAADRLTPVARELGLLSGTSLGSVRLGLFEQRSSAMSRVNAAIDSTRIDGVEVDRLLRRSGFEVADLQRALPGVRATDAAWFSAWADRRYEAYVARQRAEIRRTAAMEKRRVPRWIDYTVVDGLRSEARDALRRFRPETFGQAGRLEGVTPADVLLLSVHAKKGPGRASVAEGDAS